MYYITKDRRLQGGVLFWLKAYLSPGGKRALWSYTETVSYTHLCQYSSRFWGDNSKSDGRGAAGCPDPRRTSGDQEAPLGEVRTAGQK